MPNGSRTIALVALLTASSAIAATARDAERVLPEGLPGAGPGAEPVGVPLPGAPELPVLAYPLPDSNMGFKAERDLTAEPGKGATYMVSVPAFNGLGDIANSLADDPCSSGTDGAINADDLLCDWWSSRRGGMVVSRLEPTTGRWESRSAFMDPVTGTPVFAGDWTESLRGNEAYLAQVFADGGVVSNRIIIVGSHDPSLPCPVLSMDETEGLFFLNPPYHTMYREADEILCGLEGMDWEDADDDGFPDECPNGIFDAESGARMSVEIVDPAPGVPGSGRVITRSVERDPSSGELVFRGESFDLRPIEGVLARYGEPHGETEFCSPHF